MPIDIGGLPKLISVGEMSDPVGDKVRLGQLRAQAQEQQVRQLQMQSGQLDLQQRQQGIADEAQSRALFARPGTARPTDSEIMSTLGPTRGAAVLKSLRDADKSGVDLQKTRGEVAAQESDYAGNLAAMVKSADYSPAALQLAIQHAHDAGYEHSAQQLGQLLLPENQGNIKGAMDQFIAQSPAQQKLLDASRTAATGESNAASHALIAKTGADKAAAEMPGIAADAAAKARQNIIAQLTAATTPATYNQILNDNKVPHGMVPDSTSVFDANGKPIPAALNSLRQLGMSPDQQATTTQAATNQTQLAAHQKVEEGQGAGRLSLEQKRFNATLGAGLDANGQPQMGPDGKPVKNPVASAIANYQVPAPSPRTLASPAGQQLFKQILAENPNYDGTRFPERNKITQDFSASGASGKAMTSADTALAHLGTLSQAGAAMRNGNLQLLNSLANSVGAQVGQSPQVTYEAILQTVSPEISKAVIGGPGGETERAKMAAGYGSKLSDSQREGAIGATVQLLGARVHKMGQAYESDMGKPLARKLSPESQATLDRYAPKGSGGATVRYTSGGKSYNIPASQEAEFLKDHPGAQK